MSTCYFSVIHFFLVRSGFFYWWVVCLVWLPGLPGLLGWFGLLEWSGLFEWSGLLGLSDLWGGPTTLQTDRVWTPTVGADSCGVSSFLAEVA